MSRKTRLLDALFSVIEILTIGAIIGFSLVLLGSEAAKVFKVIGHG